MTQVQPNKRSAGDGGIPLQWDVGRHRPAAPDHERSAVSPRTMLGSKTKFALAALALLVSTRCEAQNVYSLSVYAGGVSCRDLCSFSFPFPPQHYQVAERSWLEDENGYTIVDIEHKKAKGDVLRRVLEVECGSNSLSIPLDSIPLRNVRTKASSPGAKDSGDLARMVIRCATNHGGYVTTNTIPAIQASWVPAIARDPGHYRRGGRPLYRD